MSHIRQETTETIVIGSGKCLAATNETQEIIIQLSATHESLEAMKVLAREMTHL